MFHPPSFEIIRLFGGTGSPVKLAGGEGQTWRVDSIVFKRVNPTNAVFDAEVVRCLPQIGFRLAKPIQAETGCWTVDGWAAYTYVPGQFVKGQEVDQRFETSRSFHEELRSVPHSSHLDEQRDPWSSAQRIAFGREPWKASPRLEGLLESLHDLDRAPRESWQVVHADIAGNFLFEPGLDPAIIDLTFKWSPAGLAEAVMAVDIVLWEDTSLEYVLKLLSPREIGLIPLATIRRLLEIETLHHEGGRPATIYDQVARYKEFVERYKSVICL